MIETWDIILGRQTYPLNLPDNVKDLYYGKTEDPNIYQNIRDKFSQIKVLQEPDIDWLTEFSRRAYQCI